MQRRRPSLIVVSGAPASGKTTLAEGLARELSVPLFRKDDVKETLFDALHESGMPFPGKELDVSRWLGLAAVRLLYRTAARVLDAGINCVIESNFQRGLSEADLRPLLARAEGRVIHCEAPRSVILALYRARAQTGQRHPVHLDAARVEDLAEQLNAGDFEPLAVPWPTLRVDTANGDHSPLLDVVRWVRSTG